MVYPAHYLTQFGGTLGAAGEEIWSCGIRMMVENDTPVPPNFNPADGYLEDTAAPALKSWFLRTESRIASHATLTFVKCNRIDENGLYAEEDTNEYFYPLPVNAMGGQGALPWQCSVVISWETNDVSRGLASKGRIYSPVPVVTVEGTTGLIPAAQCLSIANSASTLLNSLDDSVGVFGQVRPYIVSGAREGAAHQIDRVRVDAVVDTQRRRRNALRGNSSTVDVNY